MSLLSVDCAMLWVFRKHKEGIYGFVCQCFLAYAEFENSVCTCFLEYAEFENSVCTLIFSVSFVMNAFSSILNPDTCQFHLDTSFIAHFKMLC